MIEYLGQINLPNAKLGVTERTITANEDLRTCEQKLLAKEIAHQSHGLITEEIAGMVIKLFCQATAEKMAEGYAIQLQAGDDVAMRIFPDLHVRGGNINLKRAKELMPDVVTDEQSMVDHAGELIDRAGVRVTVRAVVQQKFTDLLDKQEYAVKRTGIVTRDYNAQQDDDDQQGGSDGGSGTDQQGGGSEIEP